MTSTLVVLAAGMGSRYGGVKQIDAVGKNGECLLDYGVWDAKESGFGRVVFIIRRDIEKDFRERLFDHIAKSFDAQYVFQEQTALLSEEALKASSGREKPWGTAHAVLCAKSVVPGPFCVINSDDYYGREAFRVMGAHLGALKEDSCEHAMVGYTLKNTMSTSGSVSRGVCKLDETGKLLVSIDENLKIFYEAGEGSAIISERESGKEFLTGDECVSMNFFGFAKSAFDSFEQYWADFIKKNAQSKKAEALLPAAVTQIIAQGAGVVRTFKSHEKWFGMTYPADRENVKTEIAKKIAEGYYPEKLW